MSFRERAAQMGLDITGANKGLFSYRDLHSEVVYRQLECGRPVSLTDPHHPTDGMVLPVLAVFTKAIGLENYIHVGRVSDDYQFVGNENIARAIKQSIADSSIGIFMEHPYLTFDAARFRDDIVLASTVQVPEVGDILPCVIVQNGYNGTKAASVSYGISFVHNTVRLTYGFKFGEMRMIHLASADTSVRESVTRYVATFQENITDVVRTSFATRLTEEQMFATLDVLESIGKKKTDDIKAILHEMMEGTPEGTLPSSWQSLPGVSFSPLQLSSILQQ